MLVTTATSEPQVFMHVRLRVLVEGALRAIFKHFCENLMEPVLVIVSQPPEFGVIFNGRPNLSLEVIITLYFKANCPSIFSTLHKACSSV